MQTGAEILDVACLERLHALGGYPLVDRMIELFLEHTRERLGDVRVLFDGGDIDGVMRNAHSIRSSAANIGALWLQDIAGRIELQASEKKWDSIGELIAEFEKCFAQTRTRLELERAHR